MRPGRELFPPSAAPLREGAEGGARGPWCQGRARLMAAPFEKGIGIGYRQRIPLLALLALITQGCFFDVHAHSTEKSSPFSPLFVSSPSVISNLLFSS